MRVRGNAVVDLLMAMADVRLLSKEHGWVLELGQGFQRHPTLVLCTQCNTK